RLLRPRRRQPPSRSRQTSRATRQTSRATRQTRPLPTRERPALRSQLLLPDQQWAVAIMKSDRLISCRLRGCAACARTAPVRRTDLTRRPHAPTSRAGSIQIARPPSVPTGAAKPVACPLARLTFAQVEPLARLACVHCHLRYGRAHHGTLGLTISYIDTLLVSALDWATGRRYFVVIPRHASRASLR